MDVKYGLHIGDYAVIAGMMSISIGIGIYHAFSGGKQKTTLEYLVGDRKMSMVPVALSLVVTFDSSILILGYPSEVYTYGIMIFWNSVAMLIIMLLASRIVVPLLFPLKLKSIFEYFDLRYKSQGPRMLGTVIGMLNYIFYIGIVLYGPALALEAVTDFPFWASVVSVAAAAILYTSIGGLKGVVWTDVVQCAIMIFGMIAVAIKGSIDAGGITKVWNINSDNLRLNIFDFNPDPLIRHTFWTLTVGSMLYYCNTAFNQATLQRISSVRKIQDAKKIVIIAGPVFAVINQLALLEGMVVFAYFNVIGCDPIKAGYIENTNQGRLATLPGAPGAELVQSLILPHLIVRIFKDIPGLPGLFLASLFSASLSTISSCLNGLSAQTVEDFIKPKFPSITDRKCTWIAKVSVILYGLLSLGITVMIANIPTSLLERCCLALFYVLVSITRLCLYICMKICFKLWQISGSILTSFAGPLAGLFIYSAFCPWATVKGFLIGGFFSMSFVLWISLGHNFLSQHPNQPWLPLNPVYSCLANSTIMSNTTHLMYNDTALRVASYKEEMLIYSENTPEGIDNLYSVSYRWFGAIGVLTSIIIGSIVSLITGYPKPEDVDARYLLPMGDMLFPYLPKRARKWLEFGVDFGQREKWLQRSNTELPELVPPDSRNDINEEDLSESDEAANRQRNLKCDEPIFRI